VGEIARNQISGWATIHLANYGACGTLCVDW